MKSLARKLLANKFPFRRNAQAEKTARSAHWEPQQLINSERANVHLSHVAAFTPKGSNAGDILLPAVLRDAVASHANGASWESIQVRSQVDRTVIRRMNATDGVVIGGGGLFLRDTNPNDISGWQWACPTKLIRRISVPFCALAVGYNRFRGQPEFAPVFKENLTVLTENSVFIGLRNTGSIKSIRRYLPHELHSKLRFQPCFTTLIHPLYPEMFSRPIERSYISFNCAFDRPELRYRDNKEEILSEIVRGTLRLSEHFGLPLKYFSHYRADEAMIPIAEAHGLDFEIVDLSKMTSAEIIQTYREPVLALGMRGHAQMIPFGCQTPILSLTSHDKLQWFLDDIESPSWGVDLHKPGISDKIFQRGKSILESPESTLRSIADAQTKLWDVSSANLADFLNEVSAGSLVK